MHSLYTRAEMLAEMGRFAVSFLSVVLLVFCAAVLLFVVPDVLWGYATPEEELR